MLSVYLNGQVVKGLFDEQIGKLFHTGSDFDLDCLHSLVSDVQATPFGGVIGFGFWFVWFGFWRRAATRAFALAEDRAVRVVRSIHVQLESLTTSQFRAVDA